MISECQINSPGSGAGEFRKPSNLIMARFYKGAQIFLGGAFKIKIPIQKYRVPTGFISSGDLSHTSAPYLITGSNGGRDTWNEPTLFTIVSGEMFQYRLWTADFD